MLRNVLDGHTTVSLPVRGLLATTRRTVRTVHRTQQYMQNMQYFGVARMWLIDVVLLVALVVLF